MARIPIEKADAYNERSTMPFHVYDNKKLSNRSNRKSNSMKSLSD